MTCSEIVMELAARDLGDAIDHTRYALSKQAASAGQVTTNYGLLVLTDQEQEKLRSFLTQLLERRLAVLEGSA
ncbi:hypothetical protein BWR19_15925 [Halomonas sp. 1513]|nr:hypothetical protein [Halomonas sp. 1513]APX94302.1 hypothetical protein BWR19_15925 [Halomonas sp. 1513]